MKIASLSSIMMTMLLQSSTAFTASTRHVALQQRTVLRAATSSTKSNDFFEARRDKACWRPTVNDVERISWGKPAKKKGTGSRGVPHRLNEDERFQFDLARGQNGFLQVAGSAWRSQRREAPLLNTYRSLCDARGQAVIVLHKQNDGIDELVIDLSPLRMPETFADVAQRCLEEQAGGEIVFQGSSEEEVTAAAGITRNDEDTEEEEESASPVEDQTGAENAWETRPIYQLPPFSITWKLPRSEAKAVGKKFATLFATAEGKKGASRKPVGVKPGKSRRHGGYGIG